MTDNFNILIHKLNIFKRKYFFFSFLRGVLINLSVTIIIYLLFSFIEYFAYLPSTARIFLFYSFIILIVTLFSTFILIPIFRILNISKQISYKKLNHLIIAHFPDIKDKLLNIIELSELKDNNYSNEIIIASIDQKIKEIKIFDFQNAISFKQLKYIFIYFLISFLTVIAIILLDKPILTESNYRIVNFNKTFSKPSPYKFILENENLKISKGDNYLFKLRCEGSEIPDLIYINIEGNNYLMKKKSYSSYEYSIESVVNSLNFKFTDLKYSSENYFLTLLPKPNISKILVKTTPPVYTNSKGQVSENTGDLKIQAGTLVEWNINCIDTDSLYIQFSDSSKLFAKKQDKSFLIKKTVFNDMSYTIFLKNSNINYNEYLAFTILVIPDLYPEISVVQNRDSSQYSRFYFKGSIADDYGFSSLQFHINTDGNDSIIQLNIQKTLIEQDFYFAYDFKNFNTKSGDISYYFSVSDNDFINGFKTTTSNSFIFNKPSLIEIAKTDNEKFNEIENLISESQKLAGEIKDDLKELQYKNLNSNATEWEKSKLVEEIINKKEKLEKLFEEAKTQNADLNNFLNSFNEQNQEIIEKQALLEKLLEDVFTEELKKLMEEFNKLAEEFNEKQFNNLSKQMDLSLDDLSKQLDRNLEMLKKMKIEQKIQNTIDRVYKLSESEEKLSQEVSETRDFENISQQDKQNQNELGLLQNELKEALDINNELKKPLNFDSFENEFNEINSNFSKNQDYLENKNRKKSAQSLNSTSENLKSLAYNMDQLLKSNTSKQQLENIENIKQLLSNLLYLSFTQENILANLSEINEKDPKLGDFKKIQNNLSNQSQVIKDSLYALAGRTPQINNIVSNELLSMELNLNKSINEMEEGSIAKATSSQQFVITAANNLALLLNEALDRLEEQMSNSMEGGQECEKPNKKGNGGKNLDMLKQSSEGLKQQLQKMIDEMKKGNSGKMSQMLGQSLMQHEMMQQMLRELINNGKFGSGAKKQLQEIDKMLEMSRKEILQKQVGQQTLFRQNQILSRLLEAEKAEMERDLDEKRESETADEKFFSNPAKYFEYNQTQESGTEQLEKNNLKLNPFFSKKYKQYLNIINEQNQGKL